MKTAEQPEFSTVLAGVKLPSLSGLSAFDVLQARGLDLAAYRLHLKSSGQVVN